MKEGTSHPDPYLSEICTCFWGKQGLITEAAVVEMLDLLMTPDAWSANDFMLVLVTLIKARMELTVFFV